MENVPPGIIPARAGFTAPHYVPRVLPGDHPRSRGVYTVHDAHGSLRGGSSPLARGLRLLSVPSHTVSRIIPARAGFTASSVLRPRSSPDHPRSRGVYASVCLSSSRSAGSSPLARGLRNQVRVPEIDVGIIPARAGFTLNGAGSVYDVKDHPRSRGVYDATGPRRSPSVGSSPLARGLPKGGASPSIPAWIIPARAGFTRSRNGHYRR